MNTIITIKIWRRPEMFRKVLDGLKLCPGLDKYLIIVSADNHCDDTYLENKIQIEKSEIKKYCDDLIYIYHNQNLGCAGNMKFCFEKTFEYDDIDYMIHLEDDTVPSKDYLQFMEFGLKYLNDHPNEFFAICPFVRKAIEKYSNISEVKYEDYNKLWIDARFEPGGGFGTTRKFWNEILEIGGLFGIYGDCSDDLIGEKWKASLNITDKGSWGWTFNKYFNKDKKCLFPKVSRIQNIGNDDGLFNSSAEWHANKIYNPIWIGADEFKDKDLSNLKYEVIS